MLLSKEPRRLCVCVLKLLGPVTPVLDALVTPRGGTHLHVYARPVETTRPRHTPHSPAPPPAHYPPTAARREPSHQSKVAGWELAG